MTRWRPWPERFATLYAPDAVVGTVMREEIGE